MKDKNMRQLLLSVAIILMAIFLYGLSSIKSTLRVYQEKDFVFIEIAHTPHKNTRWIYVSGNSPVFTSGSLIQAEGDDCAIIHRLKWRVPKVGILEVKVDFRDDRNVIVESLHKNIIMGPDPEGH